MCVYQSRKKVNEQFGGKLNDGMNEVGNCFGMRKRLRVTAE